MTTPGARPTVSKHDIEQAQAVIDAWTDYLSGTGAEPPIRSDLAHLRGLMTQTICDSRNEGYSRGYHEGIEEERGETP